MTPKSTFTKTIEAKGALITIKKEETQEKSSVDCNNKRNESINPRKQANQSNKTRRKSRDTKTISPKSSLKSNLTGQINHKMVIKRKGKSDTK